MSLTHAIKLLSGEMAGERDLSEREAYALMSAMLDGGLGELELGALLALLEHKPVTLDELLGYCAALSPRCSRLPASWATDGAGGASCSGASLRSGSPRSGRRSRRACPC